MVIVSRPLWLRTSQMGLVPRGVDVPSPHALSIKPPARIIPDAGTVPSQPSSADFFIAHMFDEAVAGDPFGFNVSRFAAHSPPLCLSHAELVASARGGEARDYEHLTREAARGDFKSLVALVDIAADDKAPFQPFAEEFLRHVDLMKMESDELLMNAHDLVFVALLGNESAVAMLKDREEFPAGFFNQDGGRLLDYLLEAVRQGNELAGAILLERARFEPETVLKLSGLVEGQRNLKQALQGLDLSFYEGLIYSSGMTSPVRQALRVLQMQKSVAAAEILRRARFVSQTQITLSRPSAQHREFISRGQLLLGTGDYERVFKLALEVPAGVVAVYRFWGSVAAEPAYVEFEVSRDGGNRFTVSINRTQNATELAVPVFPGSVLEAIQGSIQKVLKASDPKGHIVKTVCVRMDQRHKMSRLGDFSDLFEAKARAATGEPSRIFKSSVLLQIGTHPPFVVNYTVQFDGDRLHQKFEIEGDKSLCTDLMFERLGLDVARKVFSRT